MSAEPIDEKAVFNIARRIDAREARADYLQQVCGANPEALQRVRELLQVHEQEQSFLESPAVAMNVTIDQPLAEKPGTQIGPYKLLQQIGEGGMGVVYMAEQTEPVQRKVALKVIKPGMDSRQVIARFEAERQALAMMDHVNIARVLDAGATEAGRPYFVMELVHGVPITKYCDDNRLPPRQRLELFVPVCQAIQHAHQKGIIHRDIKPSNVMVTLYDGKPVPKVIDFGVAKATEQKLTERTLFTQYGTMVGTLEYMSPEQAEMSALGVDTRSDIYSLGVLLYELLTGSTPLIRKRMKEAAYAEILRLIKEEEPPKPSTRLSESGEHLASISAQRRTEPAKLTKLVRGELDWIVMKTLEKDRNRRYETANGFAADVQRYLNDEQVLACPPSAGYRLKKFVRRNRPQVIAASLVFVALVAGVVGTTLGLVRANRAAEAERVARGDAVEQKRLAERAAEEERQAKVREAQRADGEQKAKLQADEKRKEAERNLAFARKGNEILGSVFAGLDPNKIAESGRPLQDVLRENLTATVKELEGSAIGDPLEVAEMQNTLGKSLLALGEAALAVELHQKALNTYKARLGPDNPATLNSMHYLGLSYRDDGKVDLALPLHEEMLRLVRAMRGPDDPSTLASMNTLAGTYKSAGKLDLALPLHEETLRLAKATLGPDDLATLTYMGNLADSYQHAGKLDLALPYYEESLKLRKAKLGPDHPDTLYSMNNLAKGYLDAGKLDLALPLFVDTFKLRKAKLGPDHPDTLTSMGNLAWGYQSAGKLDLALPLYEEALKLTNAKRGPDHPATQAFMSYLGIGYQAAGKPELALPLFEEAFKLKKATLGPDHPETLNSMGRLASGYRDIGKLDLSLPLLEQTVKQMKVKLGPNHPLTLTYMNNLATDYHAAGKLDLALPLLEETFKLDMAKRGPDHPSTLTSMNNLAMGYRDTGKLDLALPLLEETFNLKKAKLGPDHPSTLACMNNLASCYWSLSRLDKSVPLFEELLPLHEKKLGRAHPDTLMTVANLGVNYKDAGRVAEAIALLEEAYTGSKKHAALYWVGPTLVAVYAKADKPAEADKLLDDLVADACKTLIKGSLPLARHLAELGLALLERKRYAEAEPLLRECLAIREKDAPNAWYTFNTQSALGGALLGQKKYQDAEPLLLQGYEGMKAREKTIPSVGGFRIPEALDRLIELYTATDRPEEAKKWEAERAKHPNLAPPPREKK